MRWTLIERPWHPVDDGILPYALALMRSLWVWAWLRLINVLPDAGDYGLLSWPAVFGLLAASTAIAQIASYAGQANRRHAWTERGGQALVAVSGLLAVAMTVYAVLGVQPTPADWRWLAAPLDDPLRSIPTLLIATWLWWWGVLAGRYTIFYETYANNFALGMAGLGLAAALGLALGRAPLGLLLGPALLFVAVSLITLAVASLRAARRHEREHFDPTFRVSRYWLATIVGVVVVLLAMGLLVVQLLTPDLVRRILAALSPALDLLAQALWYVLMVVTWVIFTVLSPLYRLLSKRGEGEGESFKMPSLPDLNAQLKEVETHPAAVSPVLYQVLRIGGAILVVGIVILIFALAFKRFRSLHEEDVVEVRESVLSLDLLKAQIQELLWRRRPTPHAPPFVDVAGDDPTARVRRLYQALLAWAAGQDLPRAPGMTVEEYRRFLAAVWPDCSRPLAALTSAYLQARYSAEPIPLSVADEAARAWETIQQRGQADRGR